MLKKGEQAPDFTLPTNNGGSVTLSALRGKNVILYFYPKDDTPGCTQEAKDFRDYLQEFENKNAVIIGVSKDSVSAHDAFCLKYELPFILASDESGKVVEQYGLWVQKSMYGKKYMGIERTTFWINPKGNIEHIWEKVKVNDHVKEVLKSLG